MGGDRVADVLALRELVERYAQMVDAGDAPGVARLFTEDGRLVSHLDPGTEVEPYVRQGRTAITRALEAGLARYRSTTHVIGGQVLDEVESERARGVTVCLAHHLIEPEIGPTRLLVMAIRYHDLYHRLADGWRFAERRLRLDWRDDRDLGEAR